MMIMITMMITNIQGGVGRSEAKYESQMRRIAQIFRIMRILRSIEWNLFRPNQTMYNWNGFNCTNVMEHDDDFETEGYSSWLATSLVSRRWRSHCVAGDYHRNHHHRQHHHHPASSSSAALSAPLSSSSVLTSWSENDHDNVNYSQNFFFSTATKSSRYSCLW